jgi:hypothetical protein
MLRSIWTAAAVAVTGGGRVLYKIKADGTGKAIKILGAKGQSWHFNRWRR